MSVSHPHALRAQLLNTSSASIFAGDLVEWTLSYSDAMKSHAKRARHGPRRIGIQTATVSSPKVIGRALSFAKPGEPIDLVRLRSLEREIAYRIPLPPRMLNVPSPPLPVVAEAVIINLTL